MTTLYLRKLIKIKPAIDSGGFGHYFSKVAVDKRRFYCRMDRLEVGMLDGFDNIPIDHENQSWIDIELLANNIFERLKVTYKIDYFYHSKVIISL